MIKKNLKKTPVFLLAVVAALAVVIGSASPALASTPVSNDTCAPKCWPWPLHWPWPCCPDPDSETFLVVFVDDEGNPISEVEYAKGTAGSEIEVPEDPTKEADEDYTYEFIGWSSDGETIYGSDELPDVTDNVVYFPWFKPIAKTKWERIWGDNRYGTMAAIAEEGYESSAYAVLCTGTNFPDALVATSVAGMLECPVILTKPGALSQEAADQLTRLGVTHVYVMGGSAAVSDEVLAGLDELGIGYERVAGDNRQSTSVAALKLLVENEQFDGTIVIATGKKQKPEKYFADALSIGPWCYKTTTPILLTNNKGTLNDDEIAAIQELGLDIKQVIIVGGTAVVSDEVIDQLGLSSDVDIKRLGGDDRYETSQLIAQWELEQGMTMDNVAVSTGAKFPDALAGAALCGKNNSVIILAKDQGSAGISLINNESGVKVGYVLGGTSVVSEELFEYLESLTA